MIDEHDGCLGDSAETGMNKSSDRLGEMPAEWANVPTMPAEDGLPDEWIVGRAVGADDRLYVTHMRPPHFVARVLFLPQGVKVAFVYPNPEYRMTTEQENPWTYLVLKELERMSDEDRKRSRSNRGSSRGRRYTSGQKAGDE